MSILHLPSKSFWKEFITNMELLLQSEWDTSQLNPSHEISKIPYALANVRIFKFKSGYTIPMHFHVLPALHVLLKGSLRTHTGETLVAPLAFKCGGAEYAASPLEDMSTALEDTEVLVVEPHAGCKNCGGSA
jgi:hypothetical protein